MVRPATRDIDCFAFNSDHEMVIAVDRVPPPRPGVAPVELSAVGWHGGAKDVPGVVQPVDACVDYHLVSYIERDYAWNDICDNSPLLGRAPRPSGEAIYRLVDRHRGGSVAQFSQVVGEVSYLGEGVRG